MLINISNHPSSRWGKEQKEEASKQFGGVVDIPFPNIDPHATDMTAFEPELSYYDEEGECTIFVNPKVDVIHLMGEMSFFSYFSNKLMKRGYKICVSTTERQAVVVDGIKKSIFKFIQFRFLENPFKDLQESSQVLKKELDELKNKLRGLL